MTKFDPKFALEVMRRRQGEVNKRAGEIGLEKYMLQIDGFLRPWSGAADQFDKRIHALWAEADSYDSVIEYLEDRIWEEMRPAERIWKVMEDWDAKDGPEMVGDVLIAQHIASAGRI